MNVLGIDLGTSALKAVLVGPEQRVMAETSVALETAHPGPGWSEQNPEDWSAALDRALNALAAERPDALRNVRALGLSGQMHGAVLLDAAGTPIRHAVLWNDGRATRECDLLLAAVPDLPRIAGVVPMTGLTAPKLLWLQANEPENFARIDKVVSPKDYLRLVLTGDVATDMSDAAGTLWLDQAARDWSDPILAATGLQRSHMPTLVEGNARTGEVRPALRRTWGIDGPVVVAGGAGDAAAAAIGIGAVDDGDAFVSLGTSAQLFLTDDAYRPRPGMLLHAFAHALPDRWFRMAAMLNGASCLAWTAGILGAADISALLDRCEALYRGPSRVLFLPYLSGERTPHNDPSARGAFVGLDLGVEPMELVQATLEGVAFSLLEARGLFVDSGTSFEAVAAVGGGARSRFWMQLLAHVLGIPVVRYAGGEYGPAFGAARLARLAATGEEIAAVCTKPTIRDVLEPDPALHVAYAERFESWRRLYPAVKAAADEGGRPAGGAGISVAAASN